MKYKNFIQKHSTIYALMTFWVIGGLFYAENRAEAFLSTVSTEDVVSLVNAERNVHGADALERSGVLDRAAEEKLRDMSTRGYFAHTSPEGTEPWAWFDKVSYDYAYAGENLAMDFPNASAQHEAWMNSNAHRENILNADYTQIGVAVGRGFVDGKQTTLTVQLFGTPRIPSAVATETLGSTAAVHGSENASVLGAAQSLKDKISLNTHYLAWAVVGMLAVLSIIVDGIIFVRLSKHNNIHQT